MNCQAHILYLKSVPNEQEDLQKIGAAGGWVGLSKRQSGRTTDNVSFYSSFYFQHTGPSICVLLSGRMDLYYCVYIKLY